MFADAMNGDFHLLAGSPGVDDASDGSILVDHDLDGSQRPQGAASDIGAYELPQ